MKRLALLLALLAACLPSQGRGVRDFLHRLPPVSTVVAGYQSADSVVERMAHAPLTALEGLWQMLPDGATLAIEGHRADGLPLEAQQPGVTYRLVAVQSPVRHLRPGTVIGHAVATVKPGVYRARIYTELAERTGLSLPRDFTLHLSDDGSRLTFRPTHRINLRLSLGVKLPFLYRSPLRLSRESDSDRLDGAVRIYPEPAVPPFGPVYL